MNTRSLTKKATPGSKRTKTAAAALAPTVSVIVPTLNERGNISLLLERIDSALRPARLSYEVVIIDDYSTDGTYELAQDLSATYPVAVYRKRGDRGKAFSILEGVSRARAGIICMIDADLQYPPEEIVPMARLLMNNDADVVLSNRLVQDTGPLRRLATRVYNLVFARMLFGIDYDTQSGLKVFRKEIFDDVELNPSPWSFDLEFILQCLLREYRILTHDINFGKRYSGEAKLKVVKATFELTRASLQLSSQLPRRRIRMAYQANVRFDNQAIGANS